ncbi:hypothetical protein QJS04_geneDACA017812 [Acorus gramineus]|uniref:HAT C-terminal dimerisation domain-containing protein n=1 Tax=Acorus gramineus TaxID=55184 RepID=A0AAV9BP09_ACOGR|nr:hypothetical protein QJS04_geneDACA017812 [Acorus gramineus]
MTLRVKHPSLWWKVVIPSDKYGELRRVAMRLLSQPCSASACERNWSAFDAAHTKKRNRLKPQTLNDLVYVRVNLHLQKFLLKNSDSVVKPIYLDHITAFKEVEEDALLDVDEDEREEERGLGVELESLV